jgi:hypothetical protein
METVKFVSTMVGQLALFFGAYAVAGVVTFKGFDAFLDVSGLSVLSIPRVVEVVALTAVTMLLTVSIWAAANAALDRLRHGRKMRRA